MSLFDFLTFGWLKNLTGIRKDKLDIEKGKLEIKKLKEDEVSRNIITRATMDDIEKYDPRLREIKKRLKDSNYKNNRQTKRIVNTNFNPFFIGFFLLVIILLVGYCSKN